MATKAFPTCHEVPEGKWQLVNTVWIIGQQTCTSNFVVYDAKLPTIYNPACMARDSPREACHGCLTIHDSATEESVHQSMQVNVV